MPAIPKSKQLRKGFKKTNADKWFSIFVRLRDASESGYASCCTCGIVDHWKNMDAGHFQDRGKPMTRFNEKNSHIQCKACNRFKNGEQYKHALYIDYKYGEGTASVLDSLGRIRGQKYHTTLSLKEIAKEYRIKAKKLAKEKGLII